MQKLFVEDSPSHSVNLLCNRFGQVQIVLERGGAKYSMSLGDVIPVHIGRFLKNRSQSSIACLVSPIGRVSPDNPDGRIYLSLLIAADCQETFIPKSVLEWLFSGPSADLTESFNATEFLDSFAAHSIDDLSSADYSDEEVLQGLRRKLVEAGLVTELRHYQLKGVRWLWKKLGLELRHNHSLLDGDNNSSSNSSSSSNNDHAMDFEVLAAFRGWVRLTEDISNLTSSTLPSTSSSSSSCEFSVWRNYRKGEIFDNIRQFLLDFHLLDRLQPNLTKKNSQKSGVWKSGL